ncbi:MAG: DNA methyltransferase [Candidatus Excrementavichristensenella sp.]|jgi:site-specific DNA-methyltransferase (adenine-specific)
MDLRQVGLTYERQSGKDPSGVYYQSDVLQILPFLIQAYRARVQCIYLDPPFATGKRFSIRVKVGEKDWKSGRGSFEQLVYTDRQPIEDYLSMMRQVLQGCRELLSDSGLLYLHIDYRMNARLRLMLDEIFGEKNLLNEIVWAYQTGGRAKHFFSRKHDTILLYRKTRNYYFDIKSVAYVKTTGRNNHMKRHVDPDGRIYRSIRSGGKVYTYYEDDPVYPTDVWDDVSHLQQKDPQRTGYDTQKPVALLDRIICSSSRPGDLVMDLFAGSGTTLVSAGKQNRRFVGVDCSPYSFHVVRSRLKEWNVDYYAPPCIGNPALRVRGFTGIGYYEVELLEYALESGLGPRVFSGMDALDNWSVGYFRDGAFEPLASAWRSRSTPNIETHLRLPVFTGTPMIRVADVLGRYFFYELNKDGFEI